MLNDAFLSIVELKAGPKRKTHLSVRARRGPDIKRVFPQAKVIRTPKADYLYRAEITRKQVAKALAARALAIDYTNFKDSVRENDRHDAYFQVWNAMNGWQGRTEKAGLYARDWQQDNFEGSRKVALNER